MYTTVQKSGVHKFFDKEVDKEVSYVHQGCILFGQKCIQINFVKLLHHKRAVFAIVIT